MSNSLACNLCFCLFIKQKIVQGIDLSQIRGLGFDATCSLVVLDKQFHPLPVNQEGRTFPLSFHGSWWETDRVWLDWSSPSAQVKWVQGFLTGEIRMEVFHCLSWVLQVEQDIQESCPRVYKFGVQSKRMRQPGSLDERKTWLLPRSSSRKFDEASMGLISLTSILEQTCDLRVS